MTDSQNAKPSELSIIAASSDGYIVVDPLRKEAGMPGALLFAGTLSHCLTYMESVFQPANTIAPDAPGRVIWGLGMNEIPGASAEQIARERREMLDRNQTVTGTVDLRGLNPQGNDYWDRRPGRVENDADTLTLEDILDIYRIEERMAGVQVLSKVVAVAWVGDVQEVLKGQGWWPWGQHSIPALFHRAEGPDCLEVLTKWLLEQRG